MKQRTSTPSGSTLRVPNPHAASSHICPQAALLGVGANEVSHWTDDVMVAHNVIQSVTVLRAIVLIHPVSVLQNHRLQANIVGMWDAEFDSWKANV